MVRTGKGKGKGLPVVDDEKEYDFSTIPQDEVKWDDFKTKHFLDTCIATITPMTTKGGGKKNIIWSDIVESFYIRSGIHFNKKTLKNRFDALRKLWGLWKKLNVSETGLSWKEQGKTVTADKQWWADKKKVDKGFAVFEEHGLKFADEMQQVFGSITATGFHRYAPSSGYASGEEEEQFNPFDDCYTPEFSTPPTQRYNIDTQSTGSSPPKDHTPKDHTPMESGSSGKRSRSSKPTTESRKKDASSLYEEDSEYFRKLVDSIVSNIGPEKASEIEPQRIPASILEQMRKNKEFEAMLDIVQNMEGSNDSMVLWASEYFQHNSDARMMFLTLQPKYRAQYLERAYAKSLL